MHLTLVLLIYLTNNCTVALSAIVDVDSNLSDGNKKIIKNIGDSNAITLTSTMDGNIKNNIRNSLQNDKCNGDSCKLAKGKHMESMENGTNFLIIKHFCVNSCKCWPLWAFSIAYLFCHSIIFLAFIHSTANLFTLGIWGKDFYKHGGFLLIIFSLATGCAAGLLGYHFGLCIPGILALIGGFLNLGAATILVGKRGGSLGFLSGASTGFIMASTLFGDILKIIVFTLLSAIGGLLLGVIPFGKNLRMNIKYIERCDRIDDFNKYGTIDSNSSEISSRSRLLRAKTIGSFRPGV